MIGGSEFLFEVRERELEENVKLEVLAQLVAHGDSPIEDVTATLFDVADGHALDR